MSDVYVLVLTVGEFVWEVFVVVGVEFDCFEQF